MLMADTMAIFLVILGFMLAFPGLWLTCMGVWPSLVEGSRQRCEKGLIKSFFIGLPITVAMVIAVSIVGKTEGIGQASAIGIVCLFVLYSNIGVAGLVTLIGNRLPSPADAERPWKATIRGGVVLELSYLLPLLGWFVILPITWLIGCGVTTRVIFSKIWPKKSNKGTQAISIEQRVSQIEQAVSHIEQSVSHVDAKSEPKAEKVEEKITSS